MQWLIDIIKEWVKLYLKGMIVMWSGTTADIPEGWQLCNGLLGTPDLRDRFIYGSSPAVPTGNTGGTVEHDHDFTGDEHFHNMIEGFEVAAGDGWNPETSTDPAIGTTDIVSHIPPYYALAFIMKL